MKCTNPGCTGAMNPAGQDYCQCQRCGTTAPLRDDSIPPDVREAAVRLQQYDHLGEYQGKRADILLVCQHFLGREQV